jgi:hypothetical protein
MFNYLKPLKVLKKVNYLIISTVQRLTTTTTAIKTDKFHTHSSLWISLFLRFPDCLVLSFYLSATVRIPIFDIIEVRIINQMSCKDNWYLFRKYPFKVSSKILKNLPLIWVRYPCLFKEFSVYSIFWLLQFNFFLIFDFYNINTFREKVYIFLF